MSVALLVIGNGRDYLYETVPAALRHVGPVAHRLMINDSPSLLWRERLEGSHGSWIIRHTGGVGMAGAVQAGFDLCLDFDVDHVVWIEDDMLVTRDIPTSEARAYLDANEDIAQICFRREPVNAQEAEYGQVAAIVRQAERYGMRGPVLWHDFLFSLNPCVMPRRTLELGWPSGPLGVGNESGMTARCRDKGLWFGQWGHAIGVDPYARHLGECRGAGWQL